MNTAEIAQSWYPLASSQSLKSGSSVRVEAFGQRLVLFRSGQGKLGLMHRNCMHMGGDLSQGTVTATGIRCPVHSWEFSTTGQVIGKAAMAMGEGTKPCQRRIACQEANGVIHGYFGDAPLFDLPVASIPVLTSSVYISDVDMRYDIPTIFGFDTEHFESVHNRGVDSLTVYQHHKAHLGARVQASVNGKRLGDRIMRALGMHNIDLDTDFWGGNIIFGVHRQSNTFVFISGMPISEYVTRVYASVMQQRPSGGLVSQLIGRLRFMIAKPVIRAFIAQDENALSGVRFNAESAYIQPGSAIYQWINHFKTLPRLSDWRWEK